MSTPLRSIRSSTGKVGKGGRKLSFTTKVQFNGNLMVGKAYTALLDLKPGDQFRIQFSQNEIRLVPLEAKPSNSTAKPVPPKRR